MDVIKILNAHPAENQDKMLKTKLAFFCLEFFKKTKSPKAEFPNNEKIRNILIAVKC